MRKMLAHIIEYKLGNKDVTQLIELISQDLEKRPYTVHFRNKISPLLQELKLIYEEDPQDTSTIMEILNEMQKEIVDLLTLHEQPSINEDALSQ